MTSLEYVLPYLIASTSHCLGLAYLSELNTKFSTCQFVVLASYQSDASTNAMQLIKRGLQKIELFNQIQFGDSAIINNLTFDSIFNNLSSNNKHNLISNLYNNFLKICL